MRKFLFILIQLLWVVPSLMAQQRTLAGRVLKAADNTPVSGATIRVDGTSASTMSNEDGHFSLEAPAANVTLVVTSIGYETVSMPVAASQSGEITVRLHVSSDELDEVVVTALGI